MTFDPAKTNNEHLLLISRLYEQYVDDLYNYGLSMRVSSPSCMDAIHDVFYALYVNIGKLGEIENTKSYIFRSFKNRVINMQKREGRSDLYQNMESIPFEVEVSALENIINIEDQNIIVKKVRTLLDSLTDRQREVIYLRYMQDLEYGEIAKILDMDPASARKLVYRSINKIRKEIKDLDTPTSLFLFLLFIV